MKQETKYMHTEEVPTINMSFYLYASRLLAWTHFSIMIIVSNPHTNTATRSPAAGHSNPRQAGGGTQPAPRRRQAMHSVTAAVH